MEIFKNDKFGEIRVTGTPDKPMFCLADVCKALDLGNPSQVLTRLDSCGVKIDEVSTEVVSHGELTGINKLESWKCGVFIACVVDILGVPFDILTEMAPVIDKVYNHNEEKRD